MAENKKQSSLTSLQGRHLDMLASTSLTLWGRYLSRMSSPCQEYWVLPHTEHSQEDAFGWMTILRAMALLNEFTSEGRDGIPVFCLKFMKKESREQIAVIFSAILRGTEPVYYQTGGLAMLSWYLRRVGTDNTSGTIIPWRWLRRHTKLSCISWKN